MGRVDPSIIMTQYPNPPGFNPGKMGMDERKTVYLHTNLPQAPQKNNANLALDLTIGKSMLSRLRI
jgi:hypothetical protein